MSELLKLEIGGCNKYLEEIVEYSLNLTQEEYNEIINKMGHLAIDEYYPLDPYTFIEVTLPGDEISNSIFDVELNTLETKELITRILIDFHGNNN